MPADIKRSILCPGLESTPQCCAVNALGVVLSGISSRVDAIALAEESTPSLYERGLTAFLFTTPALHII